MIRSRGCSREDRLLQLSQERTGDDVMHQEEIAMNSSERMSARPGRLCDRLLMMLVGATPAAAETLRGIVLGKEGKPVGGAVVWPPSCTHPARSRPARPSPMNQAASHWRSSPGDGGSGLVMTAGPARSTGGRSRRSCRAEAGPVTIRLSERGWLRVRLIEAETGRPIAAGRFVIDDGVELKANKLGRCELAGIAPRFHEAYVVAPGRERTADPLRHDLAERGRAGAE